MTEPPILAATRWRTNGHLIEACNALGYIEKISYTLDPTFGRGTWWTRFCPYRMEINKNQWDFREAPFEDNTFDVVAYDPPYVSVGGRKTSTIKEMHAAYGMDTAPTSPVKLQFLINAGLMEMHRVVKHKGIVLVKCQDYVSSGKLYPGTWQTQAMAYELGMEVVDRLEHIGNARPQPKGRRQLHARRNLSTLFVLRKDR